MTQLYINNTEVALPEDFTFDLVRENPYFTKGGSFTLDISLNLDIPVNARLYKHINRFTSATKFANRSALLICDGRTVLHGTEIILEVNELSASIQLCSGNSELNFLVGSDQKMAALSFPEFPMIDWISAGSSRNKKYPEFEYICATAKASSGDGTVFINNHNSYIKVENGSVKLYNYSIVGKSPDPLFRPFPYLNFFIESVIKALGYTVRRNSITSSIYNRLFIVHGNNPSSWVDVMPNMSVAEFLTEVERLLNVIIRVNSDKSVDILFAHEFYDGARRFTPEAISEQFEKTYLAPDEREPTHLTSNIRYDFESSDIAKKYDIDPDISNAIERVYGADLDSMNAAISLIDITKVHDYIYVDRSTGQEFVTKKTGEAASDYKLIPVNTFKRISGKEGEYLEISIVPVDMEAFTVQCYSANEKYEYDGLVQLPVATNFVGVSEDQVTAGDAIVNGLPTQQKLDKIQVAFAPDGNTYYPVRPLGSEDNPAYDSRNFYVTNSTVTYFVPFRSDQYLIADPTKATLSFHGPDGLFSKVYSKSLKFDTETEITMHAILGKTMPDVGDIFLVGGLKCLCKDIQFKITPTGFNPEYQATLYPIA